MKYQTEDYGDHVDTKPLGRVRHVLDLDYIGRHQAQNAQGGVPHDERHDFHDELVHHEEEVVEDLRLALRVAYEYAE